MSPDCSPAQFSTRPCSVNTSGRAPAFITLCGPAWISTWLSAVCLFSFTLLPGYGRLCAIYFIYYSHLYNTAWHWPIVCHLLIYYCHLYTSLAWPIVCQFFICYSHLFTTVWQWPCCVPFLFAPQYAVCVCSIFYGSPWRFMAV